MELFISVFSSFLMLVYGCQQFTFMFKLLRLYIISKAVISCNGLQQETCGKPLTGLVEVESNHRRRCNLFSARWDYKFKKSGDINFCRQTIILITFCTQVGLSQGIVNVIIPMIGDDINSSTRYASDFLYIIPLPHPRLEKILMGKMSCLIMNLQNY